MYSTSDPTLIWEDNTVCIQLSENPVHAYWAATKYTRLYFLRDLVLNGVVKLQKVRGKVSARTETLGVVKGLTE